jgi:hypothetical protein
MMFLGDHPLPRSTLGPELAGNTMDLGDPRRLHFQQLCHPSPHRWRYDRRLAVALEQPIFIQADPTLCQPHPIMKPGTSVL